MWIYRSLNFRDAKRRQARRRGQALVEFALIAMIFFTMLLGMIQFGMYQSTSNTLWNLSREGARYAAIKSHPSDSEIETQVKTAAPSTFNKDKLVVRTYPELSKRTTGAAVAVVVTYDMRDKIIFPLVGLLLKNRRTSVDLGSPFDKTITLAEYDYLTQSTMRAE